jgi:Uma2 family endonuclease
MAIPGASKMTAEQYLERERNAQFRSEFWHGDVCAKEGGTERHNLISGNLLVALRQRLHGRDCRVYIAEMKVGASKRRGFAYPDVAVACHERRFLDEVRDVLLNPVAIFEVFSDSTRGFDSGLKFSEYQRLDSLKHYVLIEQDTCMVQHYERAHGDEWIYRVYRKIADAIEFHDLDVTIPLAEVYQDVELSPHTE